MKKKLFGVSKQTGGIVAGATVNLDAGNASSYSGSGTDWFDLSGNGYDANLINNPAYSSNEGGYLDFNNFEYVLLNSTPSVTTSAPFTYETWFRPNFVYTNFPHVAVLKSDATLNNSPFIIALVPSSQFALYGTLTFGNRLYLRMKINDSLPINNWYQIIFTYNGGGVNNLSSYKLYINGVSKTTIIVAGAYASASNLNGIFYDGSLTRLANADLSISNLYLNKEFNQTEVTQNFDFYKSRYGL